jgi:hypothetical protein
LGEDLLELGQHRNPLLSFLKESKISFVKKNNGVRSSFTNKNKNSKEKVSLNI